MFKSSRRNLLVLSFVFAAPLSAEASTHSLARILSQVAKTKKVGKPRVENCVNLSGQWRGQCVSRKDPNDTEVKIIGINQTRCSSVAFDNLPVPNHGAFSGQVAHASQEGLGELNSSIVLSGAWNEAQSRYTVVEQAAVPALGMHIVTSVFYELDGDTLVISDSDTAFMLDEYGNTSTTNFVKYDCRLTREK